MSEHFVAEVMAEQQMRDRFAPQTYSRAPQRRLTRRGRRAFKTPPAPRD